MAELVCAATDPDWHAHRATGVTATDITAILGLNRHQSAYGLYWVKRGVVTEQAGNPRLALGAQLQPYAAELWRHEGGFVLGDMFTGGLYRSAERPWQLATTDYELRTRDAAIAAVLECKSWADADRHAWDNGPPPAVRAQVLWQMDTLSVSVGHVAVLWLPSGELSTYVIDHEDSPLVEYPHDVPGPLWPDGCRACADIALMRVAGIEFWERVTEERPPSVDGSAATLAVLKQRFPQVTPAQAEVPLELWNPWVGASIEARRWDGLRKEYEAALREHMGDAGEATINGEVVARRSRYPVKEHVRKLSWVDKITRVKNGDDSE